MLLSESTTQAAHEVFLSIIQGILPGTLWCGRGDRANVYEELGHQKELDKCCRSHDYCPIKLRSHTTRYGLTNLQLASR